MTVIGRWLEQVRCDCADYGQMLAACTGVDVVVHLAADPNPGSDWETSLLPRNVIGCYNAFHAAHQAGCSRIVFASSVNAVNGFEAENWHGATGLGVDTPVWPVNVYGAAKCFGEVRNLEMMLQRVCMHETVVQISCAHTHVAPGLGSGVLDVSRHFSHMRSFWQPRI